MRLLTNQFLYYFLQELLITASDWTLTKWWKLMDHLKLSINYLSTIN